MSHSVELPAVAAEDASSSRTGVLEKICLAIVGSIAAAILIAWIFPAISWLLPSGWTSMKANTALGAGLGALSLASSRSRRAFDRYPRSSQILGVAVILLAATALAEYIFHVSLGIDTLLSPKHGAPHAGRMSPQTGTALLLIGIGVTFVCTRRKITGMIMDFLALSLGLLVLLITSGYLFGSLRLFGLSMGTRVSLQTLVCLALLTFVVFLRRSEAGVYSILRGGRLGSRMARLLCPAALLFPFLLEIARVNLVSGGLVGDSYATALATSVAATCAFAFVLFLAWRIDGLEKRIVELSLRDDLTALYNRKGFFAHARQGLRLAQSSGKQFSVLFIDLDNLKLINDASGHHAGSVHLCEMATLLGKSFRKDDVIGRIGGDEFVVACECSDVEILAAAHRLEASAAYLRIGQQYPLSFSFGHATSDSNSRESLDEMLGIADASMYSVKRRKKVTLQTATLDTAILETAILDGRLLSEVG